MSEHAVASTPESQTWTRRMVARDRHQAHRAATPLELLYDLCFVVAVAYAAAELHHGLAHGHYHVVLGYVLVFVAIWLAWLNFAWFASAYDTDDVPYRLTVMVQIVGVLLLAAGVPAACTEDHYEYITFGYTIMRVGLIAQWLRAARADHAHRRTALRYAGGLALVQLGWLALLLLPTPLWLAGWLLLLPLELALPAWAERAGHTTWHPHHIAERYGCLTLIVLGESVLSATTAIRAGIDAHDFSPQMLALIVGGLLILMAMWWIYFDENGGELLERNPGIEFLWGYGHLVIFAAAGAVGAGLGVSVDVIGGHAHLPHWAIAAPVTVPVACYLMSVWLLHIRPLEHNRPLGAAFAVTTALVLLASGSTWGPLLTGALLAGLVTAMTRAKASG